MWDDSTVYRKICGRIILLSFFLDCCEQSMIINFQVRKLLLVLCSQCMENFSCKMFYCLFVLFMENYFEGELYYVS
jgi:hypothetical protein